MTTSDTGQFAVVSPRGRRNAGPIVDTVDEEHGDVGYAPTRVVFRGSYTEVYEHFDMRMWTDGLPIVPPTVRLVENMLRETHRDPSEILGVAGDDGVEATVWNTAVNGLMAGCRPADLPILLAIVECLTDESFHIGHAGSTTGWEILVLLSGPNLEERGFNTATGVMRVGVRANSAIGRFTRLWLRNIAGLRIPPGATDMAGIGQSFLVAMAENEAATRQLGWPPCRAEWGFEDGDLAVAVQGVLAPSPPLYSSGSTADEHLSAIAEQVAAWSGHMAGLGAVYGTWRPVLAVGPAVAEVLAREGMERADVRCALSERALAPSHWLEAAAEATMMRRLDLTRSPARSTTPDRQGVSGSSGGLSPVIWNPSDLEIVVTGNPGRNQSKYYIPTPLAGCRVVRRVKP